MKHLMAVFSGQFSKRVNPLIVALAICSSTMTTHAEMVFFGVEGSAGIGTTAEFNPGIIEGGFTSYEYFGGQNTQSLGFDTLSSIGDISLDGNSGPLVDSPLLKLRSDGPSSTQASQAFIGAMSAFQFVGTEAETITYSWSLTAELTEPANTAAFLRARAALLTEAEFFSTNLSDHFESSATIHDTMNFQQDIAGIVNESGTISFEANPGEIFYLVNSLQTYAGRSGAIADGFNTFSGNLSTSGGGGINSLSAVPEPSSAALLAIAGIGSLVVRRRRG